MSSFSPLNQASPEMELSGVRMNLKSSFDNLLENKGDSMKVYCRVRPMLQIEEDSGYTECIGAMNDQIIRAVVPKSSMKFKNTSNNGENIVEDFKYTMAFGPLTGQFTFFQDTIMDVMTGFIEGQNGLIFSYGITNSGKTYTLQGDDANPGIIPLAMHLFFACIEHQLLDGISLKPDKYSDVVMLNPNERRRELELKEQLLQLWENESGNKSDSASKSFGMTLCDAFYDNFKFEDRQTTLPPDEMAAAQSALYMKELGRKSADEQDGLCSIWVSFIEIYNEYVYDLLQPNILQRQKLNLAEDQNGDVYVKGAREICVSSCEEAIKLLQVGRRNLRIASTKLNYQSSRSHCIFTLKVIRLYEENPTSFSVNRISFCDLAGSERAGKSQTSGLRLKEAGYINTSLLVLGRCLDQLRLNQTSRDKKMIPYRESKLTRLFYGHFLGKGKATMIANVSPCELTFDETFNVLRFSALAKELTINDSYMSMTSTSIQNLTTQWGKTRPRFVEDSSHDQSSDFDNSLSVEIQEKDDIIEKLFQVADDLRENLKKEKLDKAELEIVLREEICNEFSALSDKLIENQRNISEQRIEGVRRNYQTRLDNMEKMYEDKIRELTSQLEEYEASSEESINDSVDKEHENSMSKSNQGAEYVPSPKRKLFEVKQEECRDDIFEKLECASSEHEMLISENKGLKLDLSTLQKELDSTTEQLQKYTVLIVGLQDEIKLYEEKYGSKVDVSNIKMEQTDAETINSDVNTLTEQLKIVKEELEQTFILLKQSQKEETMSKENCDVLRCKLEEANQVLEEYKKEFDELKLDAINKEREQLDLIEEKHNLEQNISSLSEKLDRAIVNNEQLKKDKLQAEDNYSQQSIEILKVKTECELKCEQVSLKLEEAKRVLEEKKSQISNLESECSNYRNDYIKLLESSRAMEEQLTLLSKETEKTVPEEQHTELDSKYKELTKVFEEQQQKLELATEKLEEQKLQFSEMESECAATKMNYNKLSDEHNSLVECLNDMKRELEKTVPEVQHTELDSKYKELTKVFEEQQQKLELATEKLQEQKLQFSEMESECTATKTNYNKLSDEHNSLVECLNDMKKELEKTVSCDKYQELVSEVATLSETMKEQVLDLEITTEALKEQKTKFNELELECSSSKKENAKLLEEYNSMKEKLNSSLKELENNDVELLNNELQTKLEDAVHCIATRDLKIDELEAKCVELVSQLKNSSRVLEEQKDALSQKCISYETEIACLSEKCSALIEDLDKMVAKSEVVEDQKRPIDELENKCNELSSKLEVTAESLRDQKSKYEELSIEATAYKESKLEIEEKYSSLMMKFNEVKTMLEEAVKNYQLKWNLEVYTEELDVKEMTDYLTSQLEKIALSLEKEQSKVQELEVECSNFKNDNRNLVDDHKSLSGDFALIKQELSAVKLEHENLLKERSAVECDLQKSSSESQENDSVLDEMKIKLEASNQTVVDQKVKIEELENKCEDLSSKLQISTSSLEQEKSMLEELKLKITSYQENNDALVEKYSALESEFNKIKMELDEGVDINNHLKSQMEYMEKQCLESKNEKAKLSERCQYLENILDSVNEKFDALSIDYEQLKSEKFKADNSYVASLSDSQKTLEAAEKQVERLKETLQTYKDKNVELKKDLKDMDNFKSRYEEQDHLLSVLGKCELTATNKIKTLHSSSLNNLEEILDLKRQVKEKETSIDQLEKAIRDDQKVKKENEAKLEKQISALKHQHSIEIEEVMHLKRISENENAKLKSALAQVENQTSETLNEEKSNEDNDLVKSKTNKGNKKKTASSKEDKEDSENKGVPKRRRPLRTQQAKASEEIEELTEDKEDSDTERKPAARSRKRKSDENEWKPAPKRTTKKKLVENAENMSPVQKAISYVGAKFRSVAQTVSNVPSPRVTRGRKKLFNVEAGSSSVAPKWKL